MRQCTPGRAREDQVRTRLLANPRLSAPRREAFDTLVSHAFTFGTGEFIARSPASVAEQAVAQSREVGAGHFLALVDRNAEREQLYNSWEMFGPTVVPALYTATV